MSVESTRTTIEKYLRSERGDTAMLAENVVFTFTDTGKQYQGRQAVAAMLDYYYHCAFDARLDVKTVLVDEHGGCVEGQFTGAHTGEFNGIPPTGRTVNVPVAVFYDVEDERIARAQVYIELPVLFAQLGATAPSAASVD